MAWGVAFTADGLQLISAGQDGAVCVWESESGLQVRSLGGLGSSATSVACSANGRWVAAGSAVGEVAVWDLAAADAQVLLLAGHTDYVTCVAFSADGRMLAAGGYDETVRLWMMAVPGA